MMIMTQSAEQSIQPLTDSEFASFRRLIEEEIGIHLGDGKRALLVARLSRRLRQGGFQTFRDYFRHVTEVDAEEKTRMFDAVCTNETQFFREAKHFRFLAQCSSSRKPTSTACCQCRPASTSWRQRSRR